MSEENNADITTLTVQLLSAFVSNNMVDPERLADLVRSTRAALTENPASAAVEAEAATYTPAVSARKSLSSPDHILSMIDGKPYKTLKRHLATHGLSPDQYRERYNLPKSYPLVAPSYSEARRAVATRLGLGRKPVTAKSAAKKAAPEAKTAPAGKAAATKAKAAASKTPAEAKTAPAAEKVAATAKAKPAAKKANGKPAAKRGPKPGAKASAGSGTKAPSAPAADGNS